MGEAVKSIWAWWRAALADPKNIGAAGGPTERNGTEFHPGYYRFLSKKEKRWVPVGIYPVAGVMIGMMDGKPFSGDLWELWSWVCKYPVPFTAYTQAVNGGGWDDEPPIALPGDNLGGLSEFEALTLEYEGEKEQILAFLKTPITSQDQADKVAIWKNRLTGIRSKAEGLHKVEKQPHLDAGREVDNKWRTLKEEPTDLAARAMAHIKPWLDKLKREEQERAAKAAADAERLRREAIEAERKAKEIAELAEIENARGTGEEASAAAEAAQKAADDLAAATAQAQAESKVQRVSAGRTGSKVTMKKFKVAVIEDYGVLAAALLANNNDELRAVLNTIANRYARGDIKLDGMRIEIEERPS